jgi:hypothetical protein
MADIISKVIWTKLFMKEQGCNIIEKVIYRDNTSAMKMEVKGKSSSGKRTRHLEIKYFYATDLIERKEIEVKYCPTDSMIADYMTKPVTGSKFNKFRKIRKIVINELEIRLYVRVCWSFVRIF